MLFSYISSLEVLHEYQRRGIGRSLVERLLQEMPKVYAVDLICDPEVQPFYEKCGFTALHRHAHPPSRGRNGRNCDWNQFKQAPVN